jgi:hypothetical protein
MVPIEGRWALGAFEAIVGARHGYADGHEIDFSFKVREPMVLHENYWELVA